MPVKAQARLTPRKQHMPHFQSRIETQQITPRNEPVLSYYLPKKRLMKGQKSSGGGHTKRIAADRNPRPQRKAQPSHFLAAAMALRAEPALNHSIWFSLKVWLTGNS